MSQFKQLEAWQRSVDLVEHVYKFTSCLPSHQRYSLCDQLERSALSVVSNVAEGAARQHAGVFLRFLSYASGSLAEVETQIIVAERVGFGKATPELMALIDRIGRWITGLSKKQEQLLKAMPRAVREERTEYGGMP